jgi:PTH2 family peptidyl-tRNA hydrolase
MSEYKQVIVLRKDLKMGCGKACAQASHAAQLALFEAKRMEKLEPVMWEGINNIVDMWVTGGYHKVILTVDSETELIALHEVALARGLPTAFVVDFGLTQLPPHTITAVGIGPAKSDEIDKITGHLRLMA